MSNSITRGGSSRSPGPSGTRRVTFQNADMIPAEDEEDLGGNPDSKRPAKQNEKPKKGNINFSELDKGLEKIHQKFGKPAGISSSSIPDKTGVSTSADNAPQNPVKKGGKPGKKVIMDLSELERGLEKMNLKFASKVDSSSSRLYSHQAWEIDPSFLKVEKILGAGSFGKVYKGSYKGEPVAIKMLEWGDPNVHDEDKEIAFQYYFFQEVEVMHNLGAHPNICKLLGASLGTNNLNVPSPAGRHQVKVSKLMCCIVMEFIEGGNLREFWVKHRRTGRRRMPFGVIVQFAIDIAEGLAFLHANKVCHRDLKPDNILMTHECTLKIADFGLARTLPEIGDEPMTLYRGTPGYAAPEILDGKEYNHKCDVYSYGICIWELYTCDVPNPGVLRMDEGPMNEDIVNNMLRPPIPCCCPAILRQIMTRCWAADPGQRPEMKEVLNWLSKINTNGIKLLTNDRVVECSACVVETVCGFPSSR